MMTNNTLLVRVPETARPVHPGDGVETIASITRCDICRIGGALVVDQARPAVLCWRCKSDMRADGQIWGARLRPCRRQNPAVSPFWTALQRELRLVRARSRGHGWKAAAYRQSSTIGNWGIP